MRIPKPINNLIDAFQKLPGIGPKTAQRLTFYLLRVPQGQLDAFAESLTNLKKNTVFCSICKNVSESDPCSICRDPNRDKSMVLVVEEPLDILVFERSGKYNGLYHALHGRISPLENIGPDEIFIQELIDRLKAGDIHELIIATNPNMEGEATAMYISQKLKTLPAQTGQNSDLKITRLGMGIPTGADVEFADDLTLTRAIEGRREI